MPATFIKIRDNRVQIPYPLKLNSLMVSMLFSKSPTMTQMAAEPQRQELHREQATQQLQRNLHRHLQEVNQQVHPQLHPVLKLPVQGTVVVI